MKTIPIFCCHYYKNRREFDNITKVASNEGILVIQNISFCEENPRKLQNQLETEIQTQINNSEMVVFIIDNDTSSRPFMDFEITYAAAKGKRIVGIYLLGKADATIPAALLAIKNKNYSNMALVKWETPAIAKALNGENLWDQ